MTRILARPILISGAGIGGLTAALALLRRGHRVRVLEQAQALGEVGAGLQLSANATRVLATLGVADALRAVAAEPEGKEIRLWRTGQSWKLFDLGQGSIARYGHPYYMIWRPDLHRVLADAVRTIDPDAIRLNARCVGFEQDDDGVRALLADAAPVDGAALIGADGVHSAVRRQLFGDGDGDGEAHYAGCIAWRGVIPRERLASISLGRSAPTGSVPGATSSTIRFEVAN